MTPNLRADLFAVLSAVLPCHDCKALTPVSALLVPAFEEREEDDLEWTAVSESALLVYVEDLDENTRDRWSAHAPQIQAVASKTAGLTYLGNVCSCGAFQGDWYLTKPGAPFFPLDDAGVSAIDVHWIDEPIVARAGVSLSAWTDWLIAKSPYGAGTRPKQGFSSRG